MNLNEALSNTMQFGFSGHEPVTYLTGVIQTDPDSAYLRLYADPRNKFKYFLIRKEDVVGELHEYTNEAIEKAGLGPKLGPTPATSIKIFQVPIKTGAEALFVRVAAAKIGEYYPSGSVNTDISNPHKGETCNCNSGSRKHEHVSGNPGYVKGMPTGANETHHYADPAYSNTFNPSYCSYSGVCRSGCQWVTPYYSYCSDCCAW